MTLTIADGMAASAALPHVTILTDRCAGCQECVIRCPAGALAMDAARWVAVADDALCVGCRQCERTCPFSAIAVEGPLVLADRSDPGPQHPAELTGEISEVRPGFSSWDEALAAASRWVALAWVGGLALFALIFGLTARSAAGAQVGASTVEQQVARMGGHQGGATSAWIGYEFVYLAALIAFAAAAQISGMRAEEADGRLDNLLARRLNRGTWLAGRLGFGVALVLATGLAAGLGGWIGVAGWHSGIGLGMMMQAGLNIAVPALFILGAGTLLNGLVPRLAAPILYTLILWSFLIEIIGSTITSNHWLLDTAILTHLGPVPATSLH